MKGVLKLLNDIVRNLIVQICIQRNHSLVLAYQTTKLIKMIRNKNFTDVTVHFSQNV